jgi:hypothetical protein
MLWWRTVRKAKISKEDRDLFERYGEAVIGSVLAGGTCPSAPDLAAIIPGNICLPPNTGKCKEAGDWLTECRDAHERREQRMETVEIGVVILITLEIVLSLFFGLRALRDGREQATALAHMDTSTAATASAMTAVSKSLQSLADAQAASLKILQQEQIERAKKPRLALYIGNLPIDKASVHLKPTGNNDCRAYPELFLKNDGEAAVSRFRLHALVPEDVRLNTSGLVTVPEYEPSANPKTRTVTLELPLLPAGKTVGIYAEVIAPKGHSAFKIPFTVDALELQAVGPLGSLTVLPPRP